MIEFPKRVTNKAGARVTVQNAAEEAEVTGKKPAPVQPVKAPQVSSVKPSLVSVSPTPEPPKAA